MFNCVNKNESKRKRGKIKRRNKKKVRKSGVLLESHEEKAVVLENYKYNKINNKLTFIHKESFAYKKRFNQKTMIKYILNFLILRCLCQHLQLVTNI